MAIHIFNCSVDIPDPQPDNIPEDLSYNDMESIVEIMLEKVLNIEDAIAENDEKDTDDGSGGLIVKKSIDISYYDHNLKLLISKAIDAICDHINYKENFVTQFHPELTSPPPQA